MKYLFTLLLLGTSCVVFSQSADSFFKEALAASEQDDFKKALKAIDLAIEQDNTKADYFNLKGRYLIELKEYQEAYQVFGKAIVRFPKNSPLYLNRGIFLLSIGEVDLSIQDFSLALEYAGDDATKVAALVNLSSAKYTIRDFQGAHKDLMTAHEIDSLDIGILNNLGTISDEIGRGEEALMYFLKVAEIDSLSVPAHVNIGFKYQKMGRYEEAMSYFDKAVELNPEEPLAYNNRGYNKLKIGDVKGALKDINYSIKLYPANSYAYRNRALVYIETNKMKKACEDLQKAIELNFTRTYGNEVEELQEKHCGS